MSKSQRSKLVESLMRACYRAESLAGKCDRAGVPDTGLERAARDFRAAAERVDAVGGGGKQ